MSKAPTSRLMLASLGKMPTTLARRFTSLSTSRVRSNSTPAATDDRVQSRWPKRTCAPALARTTHRRPAASHSRRHSAPPFFKLYEFILFRKFNDIKILSPSSLAGVTVKY